jgi:alpha-methylacyl-CoA racemase
MGPLTGVKVIEMKGLGPGPYAGMLLADMGAEVIVVERASKTSGIVTASRSDVHSRGKQSIALNLKTEQGLDTLLRMVGKADALFEGYRPGVAERLGIGPEVCLERNPRLVYGRVTGWGQDGPLSQVAGHDINFISLTGALAAIGGSEKPVTPLNLVGDYAGGSLFLVIGMLAALLEAKASGKGQVVDAAIIDGSASLMSIVHSLHHNGRWSCQRNSNFLDGGAHFYDIYETADGKFISIGPIEPQFYRLLLEKAGLDFNGWKDQNDEKKWPELKRRMAKAFKRKSRKQWREILEGTDTCFAPVMDYLEAPYHPHNRDRGVYIEIDECIQPAPAPRFSKTTCGTPAPPPAEGADTRIVLKDWGFSDSEIDRLADSGALP